MPEVLTFGETMAVARSAGPLQLGGAARISVAGAESTVAIGLARLGHEASWVGLVGQDELGALVLRVLRAEGVDVGGVRRSGAGSTGLMVAEPRVADVVRVAYYRSGSAGSHLNVEHVADALARRPRVVHATGITPALGAGPAAAFAHAVAVGAAQGAEVCLDVNYRAHLWSPEDAAATLRAAVPDVSVLVASDDELALVAPASARTERERVLAVLDAGVREVVIKRGGQGADVATVDERESRSARKVPVRDTVGAGDAFVAGYLSGLLDEQPLGARLDRAVTTAAFAVAGEGDWECLPRRDELGLLALPAGSAVR